MKLLVTGSNGQLGSELRLIAKNNPTHEFIFTDYQELDITKAEEVDRFIQELKPDYLINCAAYTAVDKAEQEQETAMKLNAGAVEILAKASISYAFRLIHISTDYVFDGKNHRPYTTEDQANPTGLYAKSKALGEKVALINPANIVIRTSWLYSAYGHNFVKTIRKAGKERGMLRVVADQIGSPTWAADLATAILKMIEFDVAGGIYHYTNEGVCSWYDFATAIVELSEIKCKVDPTDTAGYPLPAPRPFYSVLDKSKYATIVGEHPPYWRESLKKCIALLNEQS